MACLDEEPHRGVSRSKAEQSVGGRGGTVPTTVKTPEGHQPSDGTFNDPSVGTQTLGTVHAPARDTNLDPQPAEVTTAPFVVIPLVSVEFLRASAWPAGPGCPDRRGGVEQWLEQLGVMGVAS